MGDIVQAISYKGLLGGCLPVWERCMYVVLLSKVSNRENRSQWWKNICLLDRFSFGLDRFLFVWNITASFVC